MKTKFVRSIFYFVTFTVLSLLSAGIAGAQGPPLDPGRAAGGLPACMANLNTCTTNLGTCSTNLNQTQADLATCGGQFSACSTDLGTCSTNLNLMQADLATCEGELAVCSANPAKVPKTGQTVGYLPGDDGSLNKGVTWPNPRFTDNNDGTVTDNLTGLIWQKDANWFGVKMYWNAAVNECNSLGAGGTNLTDGSEAGDWRLPNFRELQSLLHYGFHTPALPNTDGTGRWSSDDPFIGVRTGNDSIYWSSTTMSHSTSLYAWVVRLEDGHPFQHSKTISPYWVWCVRDGQ